MSSHEVLLRCNDPSPPGQFRFAGCITNGTGIERTRSLRVYGAYAIAAVTRGSGAYRDGNGLRKPVAEGDVILIFPEHPHWYGPPLGKTWDEIYLVFEGAAFDLWRQGGVLTPMRPVYPTPDGWIKRLEGLIARAARWGNEIERTHQIIAFQMLLAELLCIGDKNESECAARPTDWLTTARAALDFDLARPLDLAAVADKVDMSYESFRKRFQQAVGVSPGRYRTQRRIDAARELLRYSPQITNRQAAETLGFADEYHFSRRFKEVTGVSPRALRRGFKAPFSGASGEPITTDSKREENRDDA